MRNLFIILAFITVGFGCSPTNDTTIPSKKIPVENDTQGITRSLSAIHHKIDIDITPDTHSFRARDTITIPAALAKNGLKLSINTNLDVRKTQGEANFKLIATDKNAGDVGMDRDNDEKDSVVKINVYELTGLNSAKANQLTLEFSGEINNPVRQLGQEYARGFSSSPGLIETRGAYLAGATYWYPTVNDSLLTYDIQIKLPAGWSSVSQGRRIRNDEKGNTHFDEWRADTPTEEIYIIAAEFTQYEKPMGNVTAMAYLRTPDAAIANKYLETTAQYMDMYNRLIGPYPYTKFALVENFWETGYGMPSFTLLGSQIIRFPFILHSSYPHELLHNWWGNSVYIDFDTGNWAEGLTAYMADHLVAEQRGKGAEYRRSVLQRYTNYVDVGTDFPLRKFISRSDGPTEAVGYGKTSMVFDMLREKVGDDNFRRALQKFYRDHKYKIGSWNDIRQSFEAVTQADLKPFFKQWVDGVGAPQIAIEKATQEGDHLTLVLKQTQAQAPYRLHVPIAIYTTDNVDVHHVDLKKRQQVFSVPVTGKVGRVEVDPAFNVFRRLHWAEIPPSLGNAFGAENVLVVLPSNTSPHREKRYKELAKLWAGRDNFVVTTDAEIVNLPKTGAVWIFGRNNKFYQSIVNVLSDFDADIKGTKIRFGKTSVSTEDNSTAIVLRNPENPQSVIVGLTAHSDKAIAGLARKLPHYGKYSYLAFKGDAPTNTVKGQWPTIGSPLVAVLDKSVIPSANLKSRPPLADLKPVFDEKKMMNTILTLSSKAYEGRGVGTQGLDKAADYIAHQLEAAGVKPGGENGSYFQFFEIQGSDGKPVPVKNIVGIIRGKNPKFAGQSVVLSAHYDHLGYGWPDVREAFKNQLHPGADDNGSGIAVLLEMARSLSKSAPERTIVLLAPSAEEAGLLGARHYIGATKQYPTDKIFANVNLDTVGRAGKKIMIFGGDSAREWPFIFMGTKATIGIDTELVQQSINASDHTAFLDAGIPAIHIFGTPHSDYHRPSDTAEKIEPESLIRVAVLTKEVVEYLASRKQPLTNQIKPKNNKDVSSTTPSRTANGRKVSTGSMPDFTYKGDGVKVMQVAPESPGKKAGLMPGDIIKTFDHQTITDLKSYSDTLRKYEPNDTVEIIVERNGKTKKLKLTLSAR